MKKKIELAVFFFFRLLTWTNLGKSVNSAEKGALNLVKLPSLKVLCEKYGSSSRDNLQTFVWWGAQTCSPPYKHL